MSNSAVSESYSDPSWIAAGPQTAGASGFPIFPTVVAVVTATALAGVAGVLLMGNSKQSKKAADEAAMSPDVFTKSENATAGKLISKPEARQSGFEEAEPAAQTKPLLTVSNLEPKQTTAFGLRSASEAYTNYYVRSKAVRPSRPNVATVPLAVAPVVQAPPIVQLPPIAPMLHPPTVEARVEPAPMEQAQPDPLPVVQQQADPHPVVQDEAAFPPVVQDEATPPLVVQEQAEPLPVVQEQAGLAPDAQTQVEPLSVVQVPAELQQIPVAAQQDAAENNGITEPQTEIVSAETTGAQIPMLQPTTILPLPDLGGGQLRPIPNTATNIRLVTDEGVNPETRPIPAHVEGHAPEETFEVQLAREATARADDEHAGRDAATLADAEQAPEEAIDRIARNALANAQQAERTAHARIPSIARNAEARAQLAEDNALARIPMIVRNAEAAAQLAATIALARTEEIAHNAEVGAEQAAERAEHDAAAREIAMRALEGNQTPMRLPATAHTLIPPLEQPLSDERLRALRTLSPVIQRTGEIADFFEPSPNFHRENPTSFASRIAEIPPALVVGTMSQFHFAEEETQLEHLKQAWPDDEAAFTRMLSLPGIPVGTNIHYSTNTTNGSEHALVWSIPLHTNSRLKRINGLQLEELRELQRSKRLVRVDYTGYESLKYEKNMALPIAIFCPVERDDDTIPFLEAVNLINHDNYREKAMALLRPCEGRPIFGHLSNVVKIFTGSHTDLPVGIHRIANDELRPQLDQLTSFFCRSERAADLDEAQRDAIALDAARPDSPHPVRKKIAEIAVGIGNNQDFEWPREFTWMAKPDLAVMKSFADRYIYYVQQCSQASNEHALRSEQCYNELAISAKAADRHNLSLGIDQHVHAVDENLNGASTCRYTFAQPYPLTYDMRERTVEAQEVKLINKLFRLLTGTGYTELRGGRFDLRPKDLIVTDAERANLEQSHAEIRRKLVAAFEATRAMHPVLTAEPRAVFAR